MSQTASCSSCGREIDGRDVFCAHCGAAVAGSPHECQKCGAALEPDDQFCMTCGAPVSLSPAGPARVQSEEELGAGETPWQAVLERLRAVAQGRYEIERELGEGGMAAVYLAHDIALHRRVALKVMSPAVLMERGTVGRFKQEAITIAALKHPHIVTVHAVEHHDQLHYFVLDYVEGGSLEDVMRRSGALPIPLVGAWLAQVASALEYAHKRGVVHRDIKPANILLDAEGDAIVTDFGIAKVAEKKGFTVTGSTVGTPTYMSPEQCLGRPVTGASDQYALGVVAYEMLTGTPPFTGATLEVMRAHTETPPRPLSEIRPDCPPPLAAVVTRMLEKDPSARFANLAEVIAAYGGAPPGLHDPVRRTMEALARGEPPPDRAAGSPVTPTTPLPGASAPVGSGIRPLLARHRRAFGIGTAAVALAVVGLTVLTRSTSEPAPPPSTLGVASLEIGPIPESLDAGAVVPLTATLRDAAGAIVYGEPVAWTSSDESVALIRDTLLEARGPGTARISASSGGQTHALDVTVRFAGASTSPDPDAAVASVRLSPGALTLSAGESRSLTARALDSSGRTLSGRAVSWAAADPAVASVTQRGEVRAHAPGTTEIVATIEGRRATVAVTVATEAVVSVTLSPATVELQPGGSVPLSATVVGAQGAPLASRPLEWRSSNEAIATVSAAGVVTAHTAGTAVISATAEGRSGRATVTVRAAAPAIGEAEAGRQIDAWIDDFAHALDAAIRASDLEAVRRAYQAPMSAADVTEWQRRFRLDARWSATLARTYPARRVSGSWVSDFELQVQAEAGGRTTSGPQRFLAVFEPRDGRLAVTSLEMRLSEQR